MKKDKVQRTRYDWLVVILACLSLIAGFVSVLYETGTGSGSVVFISNIAAGLLIVVWLVLFVLGKDWLCIKALFPLVLIWELVAVTVFFYDVLVEEYYIFAVYMLFALLGAAFAILLFYNLVVTKQLIPRYIYAFFVCILLQFVCGMVVKVWFLLERYDFLTPGGGVQEFLVLAVLWLFLQPRLLPGTKKRSIARIAEEDFKIQMKALNDLYEREYITFEEYRDKRQKLIERL